MKKLIELPVSQLSLLKKIHVEMDMNGKHLETLIIKGDNDPESTVYSILTDLVEEDASLLSSSEAAYIFHLIKLHNLQDKLFVHVKCGCGCDNKVELDLTKGSYRVPKRNFKAPSIKWTMFGKTEEYHLYPVTLSREIAIRDWCMTVKDLSVEDIKNNKELEYQITAIRALSCLVNSRGEHVYETQDFDKATLIFRENSFITIRKLLEATSDIESYGPQLSSMQTTCKGCKKELTFRVSPLAGLTN